MSKETMLVVRKDTGEEQLINADRFNEKLHDPVDAAIGAIEGPPEATESPVNDENTEEVSQDLSKLKKKELVGLAKENGLETDGLKKKELLSLLSK